MFVVNVDAIARIIIKITNKLHWRVKAKLREVRRYFGAVILNKLAWANESSAQGVDIILEYSSETKSIR